MAYELTPKNPNNFTLKDLAQALLKKAGLTAVDFEEHSVLNNGKMSALDYVLSEVITDPREALSLAYKEMRENYPNSNADLIESTIFFGDQYWAIQDFIFLVFQYGDFESVQRRMNIDQMGALIQLDNFDVELEEFNKRMLEASGINQDGEDYSPANLLPSVHCPNGTPVFAVIIDIERRLAASLDTTTSSELMDALIEYYPNLLRMLVLRELAIVLTNKINSIVNTMNLTLMNKMSKLFSEFELLRPDFKTKFFALLKQAVDTKGGILLTHHSLGVDDLAVRQSAYRSWPMSRPEDSGATSAQLLVTAAGEDLQCEIVDSQGLEFQEFEMVPVYVKFTKDGGILFRQNIEGHNEWQTKPATAYSQAVAKVFLKPEPVDFYSVLYSPKPNSMLLREEFAFMQRLLESTDLEQFFAMLNEHRHGNGSNFFYVQDPNDIVENVLFFDDLELQALPAVSRFEGSPDFSQN